jgi:hypothetical protein
MVRELGGKRGAGRANQGSRHQLEKEMSWHTWFEVFPDRVVFYMWAMIDNQITFSFTPRFAGNMVTAPSCLYDYYNPEERLTLPPHRFSFDESQAGR